MKKPKVSFIIPVYKSEKYLTRCLDSIINQTEKEIEAIIINDGSPDTSPIIADQYAAKDSRIKVIHKNNEGVSFSRNLGISLANGEFIMFVDSDDWIRPETAESMLNLSNHYSSDIVICENVDVFSKRNVINPPLFNNEVFINKNDFKEKIYREFIYGDKLDIIWKLLIRKSILVDHNLYFNSSMSLGEDTLFSYKLFTIVDSVAYTPKPYYYYFKHNEGLSGKGMKLERTIEDAIKLNEYFLSYSNQWGFSNPKDNEKIAIKIFNNVLSKTNKAIFFNSTFKLKHNYNIWISVMKNSIILNSLSLIENKNYKGNNATVFQLLKNDLFYLAFLYCQLNYIKLWINKILANLIQKVRFISNKIDIQG
jgi:glycosyltransferase involved in cell wall biosynthesis